MKTQQATLLSSAATVLLLAAAPLFAAPINYGDFEDYAGGGVVQYTDVTESTSTDVEPQFGAPDVTVNELDFDPTGFGSSASGGAVEITDGQLNFGFNTNEYPYPATGLSSLLIEEGGDFTLFGAGTAATSVNFGLFAKVTVTAVNGVTLAVADQFDIIQNASSSADVVTSPGLNQAWSLSTLVEFGPSLASEGFAPGSMVTAGEFVLNNTLITSSEPGTLAFIAKKDFSITPGGDLDRNDIPEPTTALLAGLALAGFAARRR